ncbi:Hypothetical protein NGAL_HAMBI1145_53430 [Neorhizobium galegae bv. officinalis]|uniref:DUF4145 domain-containing protein n=1 Tax=Neorhizobium galegae bv. officinalis TaxID=323656 RepID=A0A0T7FZ96_NEOGA|nr:hypothetical protein [Neorhizobium galegae]CDZ40347.1 Hypothetical protein NGAL_HAMBI1145_53430 [Neorhizobium galegae bv. officinalis]
MLDDEVITVPHEFGTERFRSAFMGSDDVGAVIRCHFEAERVLDFVLEQITERRSTRKVKGWPFAHRLEVCRLFGIDDVFIHPFKLINDVRNELAHKGIDAIDEQAEKNLYHAVRKVSPKFDPSFRVQFGNEGGLLFDKPYSDCSTKEKYVFDAMMAIMIFASVPARAVKRLPLVPDMSSL